MIITNLAIGNILLGEACAITHNRPSISIWPRTSPNVKLQFTFCWTILQGVHQLVCRCKRSSQCPIYIANLQHTWRNDSDTSFINCQSIIHRWILIEQCWVIIIRVNGQFNFCGSTGLRCTSACPASSIRYLNRIGRIGQTRCTRIRLRAVLHEFEFGFQISDFSGCQCTSTRKFFTRINDIVVIRIPEKLTLSTRLKCTQYNPSCIADIVRRIAPINLWFQCLNLPLNNNRRPPYGRRHIVGCDFNRDSS